MTSTKMKNFSHVLWMLGALLFISCSTTDSTVVDEKAEARSLMKSEVLRVSKQIAGLSPDQHMRLKALSQKSSLTLNEQDELVKLLGFSNVSLFIKHNEWLKQEQSRLNISSLTTNEIRTLLMGNDVRSKSCEGLDACIYQADADYWFRGIGCVALGTVPVGGLVLGLACAGASAVKLDADYKACKANHECKL